MNLQETIRRVLREEANLPVFLKRRFGKDELDDLIKDIKDQIEEGESLDTAIYDTIRQFVATKNFNNIVDTGTEQQYWDSYLVYEKPLVKYVKERLNKQHREEQNEGLHDTSWKNDKGDKITLIDLLNATEDIPVKNISVKKLKPHLLTWDSDEEEIKKIEKADLKYPILIFVDNRGRFISIIDGHHRAQKAVRKGLKTIKGKIIPVNSLPNKMKKVFGHLGKQEQTEGEITEKCWKGYTQKGMKTMFGKRYPNCVKKTK
jgi:hypothetical protein